MADTERDEALRLANEAGFEFEQQEGGKIYTELHTQYGVEYFAELIRLARALPQQEPVAEVRVDSPNGIHWLQPIDRDGVLLYTSPPAQGVPVGSLLVPEEWLLEARDVLHYVASNDQGAWGQRAEFIGQHIPSMLSAAPKPEE